MARGREVIPGHLLAHGDARGLAIAGCLAVEVFDHYRLRVLLHAGGVTWPSRPSSGWVPVRQCRSLSLATGVTPQRQEIVRGAQHDRVVDRFAWSDQD